MVERAVSMLDAFRLPHWDANDYGVVVVDTWFEVHRGRTKAGVRSRMWIGSHALARWYQRSGARSDERLLYDIGIGAAIDTSDRKISPDLDDVRVAISMDEGWRGAMMLAPEDKGDDLVFYANILLMVRVLHQPRSSQYANGRSLEFPATQSNSGRAPTSRRAHRGEPDAIPQNLKVYRRKNSDAGASCGYL